MTLLFCISHLPAGGAERQVIRDTLLLTESGFDVHIAFGSKKGKLMSLLDSRVKQHPLKTQHVVLAAYRLRRLSRKIGADLIITHMFWANKTGGLCTFFNNIPFIAFEHGLGFWRKRYHRLWISMYSRKATNVITCSLASMRRRIHHEKIDPKKLQVIYNSFRSDGTLEKKQNQSCASAIAGNNHGFHEERSGNTGNTEKAFVVGYAGRFHPVKQLRVFLHLAEMMKKRTIPIQFLLLGDGEERQIIQKEIQKKKLDKYFKLTGFVEKPEIYYQEMDCFILPSKREDFSLSLIEASSAGLPCIAFDVGGNSEIVKHSQTGFIIPPFDIDLMADKIYWLYLNRSKCKEMGHLASEYVLSNFNEKKRLTALKKLIHQTISE